MNYKWIKTKDFVLITGTDATHAEHIEKIKSRNYVGVQADGTFLPGELGMGLVEGKFWLSFPAWLDN
mgnify:CR=1 FL=1